MRQFLAALVLIWATPARAEPPQVVTDIAPIHSLVSEVMGSLGKPVLLLDAGSDPHHITLRPSQARALTEAQAVFWVGPALTPWLAKPVAALQGTARTVSLSELPGTWLIAPSDDDDHALIDPHVWLDPDNAALWLPVIAEILGGLDPSNAVAYAANAESARQNLQDLATEIANQLAPFGDAQFLVTHDAYVYFSTRFGLHLDEAISDTDAAPPSAARLSALLDIVQAGTVICAFREPQQSAAALATVLAGTDIPQAMLDPLGTALPHGPSLYPDLLQSMADAITSCAAR